MKLSKWLVLSLCVFFAHPVFALRCKSELVDLGDIKEDVIAICGEPKSIDSHIERRAAISSIGQSQFNTNTAPTYPRANINYGQQQYIQIDVVVEEWIYDFGRTRFQQYLRFENGRLTDIQSKGRGH
jgi:hypothetical protein